MRRAVAILLIFTRSSGHLHANLRPAFGYYHFLLVALSLGEEEIRKRIAELGQEAGLDSESYRKHFLKGSEDRPINRSAPLKFLEPLEKQARLLQTLMGIHNKEVFYFTS